MSCWCIQCGSMSCVLVALVSYALVMLWWFVVVRAVVVRATVMVVLCQCCGCAVVLLWLQRWCCRMLWEWCRELFEYSLECWSVAVVVS